MMASVILSRRRQNQAEIRAHSETLRRGLRGGRGDTRIETPPTSVADLPGGPLNHHWTKGLIASADGTKLYVSVGSNSNAAEHGVEHEEGRAAIWEFGRATGHGRVFAGGLRNPWAWRGGTRRCGRWSTSVTSSGTTWSRTT
jgi:glucose/arabinose dehydrogenase